MLYPILLVRTLDPALQDRGFLVSDNLFSGIPTEFSGANPIFAGYVADTTIEHNTIHNTRYSGICAGWGWGMSSYTRNIHIMNNSFTKVMQVHAVFLLAGALNRCSLGLGVDPLLSWLGR